MGIRSKKAALDRWAETALHTVPRNISAGLFLVGLAVNFANIVGRYVFNQPIMAAEELLIYLMIWCIFLGAALVTYEGSHLKMDLLAMHLSPKIRNVLDTIAALIFLAIAVAIVDASLNILTLVSGTDEKSVVAGIPMEIPYAVLPISFGLMALAVIWRLVALVRGVGTDTAKPDPLG